MSKKKQQKGIEPEEEVFTGNLGSPFAELKVDVPPPPEPPKPAPPPPPTREELMEANLSRADKEMLAQFRQAGIVPEAITRDNKASHKIRLNLSIQRKGHKGRVVTNIRGLDVLPVEERMELCSQIRTALGCGARFVETVLEVQGDQREKASKWLENKNFACTIG
ncbi:MAG: translation initiation factor [Victivallales bacterium]|nr:translation initiation factor [Victivallales bacterium]